MSDSKVLFQAQMIGNVRLKNRIAMAPMGVEYMTEPDGTLNRRVVDYYLERARGGVGMLICSVFKVENRVEQLEDSTPMIQEASLNYLGELCDAAHSLGCKVFVQLSAGFGRVTSPSVLRGPCRSPSENTNFWDTSILCKPLSVEEIGEIVKAMGESARLLALAGVDGIELHGHEGYLLDEFSSSLWNKRKDHYGGSLDNRLRFPIECLQEIRKNSGDSLAVIYRFGLKHYLKSPDQGALPGEKYEEVGRDIEEGRQMAQKLEEAGFDALHVDAGCYESHYWPHPPIYQKHGCMVDMAKRTKEVVSIPVIAVGRLDDAEIAQKTVEEGCADIVAIGRGLLADPLWANKLKYGDPGDIKPCIGCYEGCFEAYSRFKSISCAVNPASGRESAYRLQRADIAKNVMVIGGGVAGMEAARVAALRGHRVTLYEKTDVLGGIARQAAVPDFKNDLVRLLSWYKRELEQMGIAIKMESIVNAETPGHEKADVILMATGASPIIPGIRGAEGESVCTVVDLLKSKRVPGKRTIIIGGGLTGCEAALWLNNMGKEAVLVEMCPQLMTGGAKVPFQVRRMTLDLIARSEVEVLTGTKVSQITAEGVHVVCPDGSITEIQGDRVAFSIGMRANSDLFDELEKSGIPTYRIGDCRAPKNIMNAIWDAYELTRFI
ncbi:MULTISPECIES: FAD-dependent oxidoreductase [unclassified Oceanispirochaeta]|uniref:oxidoreductase n=1 Tax=unclassified Oceanispirochaeta TaxID=2635722 RepID=UPI000E09771D|nr:FAD-dependent oxidoreductase [Oceanispirochaeta sp. M1]MBF9015117.1 FAD-dependent oxidoreductase [Oceanispirochaeta sp. M2]NPD71575.1 FAD-dependent oxidoreductase [Oceanispirochaeta sp. M1]RDG33143.1 FAD-dependent oxidoreductase [Oceanispirochaeta sp. M1]